MVNNETRRDIMMIEQQNKEKKGISDICDNTAQIFLQLFVFRFLSPNPLRNLFSPLCRRAYNKINETKTTARVTSHYVDMPRLMCTDLTFV